MPNTKRTSRKLAAVKIEAAHAQRRRARDGRLAEGVLEGVELVVEALDLEVLLRLPRLPLRQAQGLLQRGPRLFSSNSFFVSNSHLLMTNEMVFMSV